MSDLVPLVALSLLPSWTRRLAAEQLRTGENPARILERLVQICCAGQPDRCRTLVSDAEAALGRASQRGLRVIGWDDAAYPAALAAIADPPPVLWFRGDLAPLDRPAVAIVGSRAGSPYALQVAADLAGDLAARGVTVVSGLARGVDSAAHGGALAVDAATVAVLGCGADVVYPPEHRDLSARIAASGALVSELVPGTPPLAWCFPLRNRIISGLSRAVVVIEAGERSGSLITARAALDQGRDVLAVPGSVLTGRNRGAHALLKDGAKIVETADDILDELGIPTNPPEGPPASKPRRSGSEGSTPDPVLAALVPGESCDFEGICERSGLAPARLLPRLLDLELRGLVRRAGGGRFVRV
jgi:DNA processing protein